MREKAAMDGASEELERRSRYLSSLIEKSKLKADANLEKEPVKDKEKEREKGRDGGGGEDAEDDLKCMQNVRVRASDMPMELQRRAFRCAREVLSTMPKLDSKRLALSLKKDYKDVFPVEVPAGLPPIRGIEHQIDFVPGDSIPNLPAYRSNPKESKELQRQVEELMEKGYVQESMSPCTVPVILVPKKHESWRMCVDCRAINNITVKNLILLMVQHGIAL